MQTFNKIIFTMNSSFFKSISSNSQLLHWSCCPKYFSILIYCVVTSFVIHHHHLMSIFFRFWPFWQMAEKNLCTKSGFVKILVHCTTQNAVMRRLIFWASFWWIHGVQLSLHAIRISNWICNWYGTHCILSKANEYVPNMHKTWYKSAKVSRLIETEREKFWSNFFYF